MDLDLTGTPYRLGPVLGVGSFSKVFSATDTRSGKSVAVKWAETPHQAYLLNKEAGVMRDLNHCRTVPRLLSVCRKYQYIVMKRVGKTLLELQRAGGVFTMETICVVGSKCVCALEEMHSCGYVHRDLKPDNLTVSLNPSSPRLYLIDFGLSTKYVSEGLHVKYSEAEEFQGTPYFCSLNSLKGVKYTRRDDMEGLGYVLLFLRKGRLPWMGGRDLRGIEKCRERISIRQLCEGESSVFVDYLQYCQNLKFYEKPSYHYLRGLFTARGTDWSSLPIPSRTSDQIPAVRLKPSKLHKRSKSFLMPTKDQSDSEVTPKASVRDLPAFRERGRNRLTSQ